MVCPLSAPPLLLLPAPSSWTPSMINESEGEGKGRDITVIIVNRLHKWYLIFLLRELEIEWVFNGQYLIH